MRVKVRGARGSVRTPGPSTKCYGGNTSCLQLTLSDGRLLVLDAGSGIRNLGLRLAAKARRIDILLTHLHLDHIQGLMFFAPLFVIYFNEVGAATSPRGKSRSSSQPRCGRLSGHCVDRRVRAACLRSVLRSLANRCLRAVYTATARLRECGVT
jgi:phosphoribosyl 1,2-cyclic phosphodiesterase